MPGGDLHTVLRQPSLIEARTAGILSAEYSLYPVLYPLEPDTDPKLEPILGYHEVNTSVGVERSLLGQHLTLGSSYNAEIYYPFSYQGDAAKSLEPVYVWFPKIDLTLDYRDDPVVTTRGVYASTVLETAGYVFRGSVSNVRVRPEIRAYTQGAAGKRSVFAARLAFGFLFPRQAPGRGHYGETLLPGTPEYELAATNPGDPAVIRDQQKLLLRAFYSGGPSSNRGYPLRGVGPQGPIGFLVPSNLSSVNCSLDGRTVADLPPGCRRPLGGLTLWELSLELRFPIGGSLFGALFVNASNVTRETAHIRFNVPHMSPGVGLRYMTPVGPFRLDFGFRPPYLQAIGKRDLPPEEGATSGTILGAPLALDIAIGEAF